MHAPSLLDTPRRVDALRKKSLPHARQVPCHRPPAATCLETFAAVVERIERTGREKKEDSQKVALHD